MSKKRLFGSLVVAGTAAVAASLLAPAPAPNLPPITQGEARHAAPAANGLPAALPVRETLGKLRGDLFSSRAPTPAKPPAPAPSAEPQAPAPPPMPYRVAGQVVRDGKPQVLLMRGDRVFTAQQGDILEGGYRVESIDASSVTLVDTSIGATQQLPLASKLGIAPSPMAGDPPTATSGPAKLRWQGPERVFAGSPFEVVLKLTSAQPVRSSPLELTYDAKLLEPVAVRAGGSFAGGKFSYRVAPGGSIFVGASGSGAAAADLDLLILTFKAIRSGGSAELKLSSVILEGADGDAITHEPPAAFRTTIVQ